MPVVTSSFRLGRRESMSRRKGVRSRMMQRISKSPRRSASTAGSATWSWKTSTWQPSGRLSQSAICIAMP